MTNRRSDILLHPIRLRVVLAAAGDEVTTAEIADRLRDVPQATLYRHIATLAESGLLEVVGERQARGAIEKTYRVSSANATLGSDDLGGLSAEDHLEAFATFAGVLIDTYARYLETPGADPGADGVSFRRARLWLQDGELEALIDELRTVLDPYIDLPSTPQRKARLLSTVLMPDPAHTSGS